VGTKTEKAARERLFLKDLCGKNNITWEWDSVSQVVTLSLKGVRAKALVGSDVVLIGEEKVLLSAPLKTVKSSIVVSGDFQEKVIDKILNQSLEKADYFVKRVETILIDAGHGGKDPGTIGVRGGRQEKEVVLDIAKRLRNVLEAHGFKVNMTRDKDEFISLKERTEIACRSKVDLFISVHANSNPVRSVNGLEVYSLKDLNYVEKEDAERRENHQILFQKMAMKRNARDVEGILEDMLYTNKQSESRILAEYVAKETTKMIGSRNRGIKESHFFVLRNTLIPAVLVEVGFMSNPREERLLRKSLYRQKIANGLARSIMAYANRKN